MTIIIITTATTTLIIMSELFSLSLAPQTPAGVLAPGLLGGRPAAAPTLRAEPLRIHALGGRAQGRSRKRSVSPRGGGG